VTPSTIFWSIQTAFQFPDPSTKRLKDQQAFGFAAGQKDEGTESLFVQYCTRSGIVKNWKMGSGLLHNTFKV